MGYVAKLSEMGCDARLGGQMNRFRPKQRVYDRWWPWRAGYVLRVGKTRVRVRWSDGTEWSYDTPHLKFLSPERPFQ